MILITNMGKGIILLIIGIIAIVIVVITLYLFLPINPIDTNTEKETDVAQVEDPIIESQFSGLDEHPELVVGTFPYADRPPAVADLRLENDGSTLEFVWNGPGSGDINHLLSVKDENSPLLSRLITESTIPLNTEINNYFIIGDTTVKLRNIFDSQKAEILVPGLPGGGYLVKNYSIGDQIHDFNYTILEINADNIVLDKPPQKEVSFNEHFSVSFEQISDNRLVFINDNSEYIFDFYFDPILGVVFNSNSRQFDFEEAYLVDGTAYVLYLKNDITLVYFSNTLKFILY